MITSNLSHFIMKVLVCTKQGLKYQVYMHCISWKHSFACFPVVIFIYNKYLTVTWIWWFIHVESFLASVEVALTFSNPHWLTNRQTLRYIEAAHCLKIQCKCWFQVEGQRNCSRQWRSSMPVCARLTVLLVPKWTQGDIFGRTCLQSHLKTSPTTPLKSYAKFMEL
jgi:hypothetical protein